MATRSVTLVGYFLALLGCALAIAGAVGPWLDAKISTTSGLLGASSSAVAVIGGVFLVVGAAFGLCVLAEKWIARSFSPQLAASVAAVLALFGTVLGGTSAQATPMGPAFACAVCAVIIFFAAALLFQCASSMPPKSASAANGEGVSLKTPQVQVPFSAPPPAL